MSEEKSTSIFDTIGDTIKEVGAAVTGNKGPNPSSKTRDTQAPSSKTSEDKKTKSKTNSGYNPRGEVAKTQELQREREIAGKEESTSSTGKTTAGKNRPISPIEKLQLTREKGTDGTESPGGDPSTSSDPKIKTSNAEPNKTVIQAQSSNPLSSSNVSFFSQNSQASASNSNNSSNSTSLTTSNAPFNPTSQPNLTPSAEQMAKPTMTSNPIVNNNSIPGFAILQASQTPQLIFVDKKKLADDISEELNKAKDIKRNDPAEIKKILDQLKPQSKTADNKPLRPAMTPEEYKAMVKQLANLFGTFFNGVSTFSTFSKQVMVALYNTAKVKPEPTDAKENAQQAQLNLQAKPNPAQQVIRTSQLQKNVQPSSTPQLTMSSGAKKPENQEEEEGVKTENSNNRLSPFKTTLTPRG